MNENSMSNTSELGILTQKGHPLFAYWLSKLSRLNLGKFYIIIERKAFSTKDTNIFYERTGNYFSKVTVKQDFSQHDVLYVSGHNSSECLKFINEQKLKLLINCGTPSKLLSKILSSTECGVLNVHPGILPRYRGASAVEWALWNKDRPGATAHLMAEEYDNGPIIRSQSVSLADNASYRQIRVECYKLVVDLMCSVLEDWNHSGRKKFETYIQNENDAKTWPPMNADNLIELIEKIGL